MILNYFGAQIVPDLATESPFKLASYVCLKCLPHFFESFLLSKPLSCSHSPRLSLSSCPVNKHPTLGFCSTEVDEGADDQDENLGWGICFCFFN